MSDYTGRLTAFTAQKYHKDLASCTTEEIYAALLQMIRDRPTDAPSRPARKLYYISAEFLTGRLLTNNLINLGWYDGIRAELAAAGAAWSEVEEFEPEPALGNGGLGRLAACYLDAAATLGLPGDGIGLNYHFGLFRQKFSAGRQTEEPEPWLRPEPFSWLRPVDQRFSVPCGRGTLQARLYDLEVIGGGGRTNRLHLFDLEHIDEDLAEGGLDFDKNDVRHNLTLFLYPDDSDASGRILRLCQQYFLVSCAAQYILWELEAAGRDCRRLPEYVVIQINDTHPALIIPELVRLLLERGLSADEAIAAVSGACAYTNHTILAEALEKWPAAELRAVAPRLMPIIHELNRRVLRSCDDEALALVDDRDLVHMARLAIHYGFSVNGVAALHTQILCEHELAPFYRLYPAKFSNKTNGVSFRRWLIHCNPGLCALLDDCLGQRWRQNTDLIGELAALAGDSAVPARLARVKEENKTALAAHLAGSGLPPPDPAAVFDIQIKRLHAYKRQILNALYLINAYLRIKEGHIPAVPLVAVFGAKAAPAYELAKDTIHLLLCLEKLINSDPQTAGLIRIIFVENYNVSAAEKLIPAADVSEQISLASREASGTGNMKMMLNGAITLGTLDGANVEIAERVGAENIYIFGRSSAEVLDLYERQAYDPGEYLLADPLLEETTDFIVGKQLMRIGDARSLSRLYVDLIHSDRFMALADLRSYITVKEKMLADYAADRTAWSRKALANIAAAPFFSADRAVREYNRDIWRLEPGGRNDGKEDGGGKDEDR
ncbi:MAG: glycogen/starch/alpha-glucan family phosphorylase [Gracilibacteraceae bacterium]|nr:glycogen/starch/alpha-glucan family phosphorylase [Gracilibacteraceae bacterium]